MRRQHSRKKSPSKRTGGKPKTRSVQPKAQAAAPKRNVWEERMAEAEAASSSQTKKPPVQSRLTKSVNAPAFVPRQKTPSKQPPPKTQSQQSPSEKPKTPTGPSSPSLGQWAKPLVISAPPAKSKQSASRGIPELGGVGSKGAPAPERRGRSREREKAPVLRSRRSKSPRRKSYEELKRLAKQKDKAAQKELTIRQNLFEANRRQYAAGHTGHFPPRTQKTIRIERLAQSGFDEARDLGIFPKSHKDPTKPVTGTMGVVTPKGKPPQITFSGSSKKGQTLKDALKGTSAGEQLRQLKVKYNNVGLGKTKRNCAACRIDKTFPKKSMPPTGESWIGENNPHPLEEGLDTGGAMRSCAACQADFPYQKKR